MDLPKVQGAPATSDSSLNYQPSLTDELVRVLYSLLFLVLLPVFALLLWRRKSASRCGADGECWQRLGLKLKAPANSGWLFHCASVGEVVAASGLINRLLAEDPQLSVTITTMTPTGAARVKQLFNTRVQHVYLPFDLPFCMSRLVKIINPQRVVVTEVEFWPNLFHQCWRRKIPLYIVNGRMTEKSFVQCQRYRRLFLPALKKTRAIGAQAQRDYKNFLALGLAPPQVQLTRNIKFDITLTEQDRSVIEELRKKFNASNRPLILAGSTHEPEERVILDAFKIALTQFPNALLIIAPRHPQRFDDVFELCQMSGLKVVKASTGNVRADTQLLFIDTMGRFKKLLCFCGYRICWRLYSRARWSQPAGTLYA